MNKFTVRPGYGSKDLLIEFNISQHEKDFQSELFKFLRNQNYIPHDIKDLVFYERVEFKSNWGKFYFEQDEWGSFWISADNNETVENLAKQLEASPTLERYEENWDKYKKAPKVKNIEEERMESMMNDGCQTSLLLLFFGASILAVIIYLYIN